MSEINNILDIAVGEIADIYAGDILYTKVNTGKKTTDKERDQFWLDLIEKYPPLAYNISIFRRSLLALAELEKTQGGLNTLRSFVLNPNDVFAIGWQGNCRNLLADLVLIQTDFHPEDPEDKVETQVMSNAKSICDSIEMKFGRTNNPIQQLRNLTKGILTGFIDISSPSFNIPPMQSLEKEA